MEIQFRPKYYVFIAANATRDVLKPGIAINLPRHFSRLPVTEICSYLIYFECYHHSRDAVLRELDLLKYSARKLTRLVKQKNPLLDAINIPDSLAVQQREIYD